MTDPPREPSTAAASIITYRMGGRSYPLRAAATCHVCQSIYRFEIETQIASGRTFANIIRHLPEDHDLEPGALKRHYDAGHMPMEIEAARRIVEERAIELGRHIEDGANDLVDQTILARTVMQRTFEGIVSGELEPTINDGIQAARLLEQMGINTEEVDQQAWVEAFMIYHETAQQYMDNAQFAAFGESLAANPILQALINQKETPAIEATVLSDEVDEGEN